MYEPTARLNRGSLLGRIGIKDINIRGVNPISLRTNLVKLGLNPRFLC